MLKIFNAGKAFTRQQERDQESEHLKHEAEQYDLASDGGYLTVLKSALFLLFAYYNARLFIVTVPGWGRLPDGRLCPTGRSDGVLLLAQLHPLGGRAQVGAGRVRRGAHAVQCHPRHDQFFPNRAERLFRPAAFLL